MFEKLFRLSQHKTTFKTEIIAGVVTFLTMAYIIFLQPAILSVDFNGTPTGMNFGALIFATCLISGLASIFMGLYANYPIALAPGMGENFFFVSVIMALTAAGIANAWQVALGVVFIAGVLFLILSLLRFREQLITAISPSLRNGIAVGIGLFIAFIGLKNGKIIVPKDGTIIGLNPNLASVDIGIFTVGLIIISILRALKVKGDILIGIFFSTVLALSLGVMTFKGVIGFPDIQQNLFFQMDLKTAFSIICVPFILIFLFMDVFDTIGTLMGVAETADLVKDNKLPNAKKVLIVDAAATMAGACCGSSTVTSYIESVSGVAVGGKTGLTSITTGLLFLIALFFSPFIETVGRYTPITAPALIIVGTMMMANVRKIDWEDPSEYIPAFLIMIGIPLTFSIADGLALGLISYPIIKFFSGKGKDVHWIMYLTALIVILFFVFVRGHLS